MASSLYKNNYYYPPPPPPPPLPPPPAGSMISPAVLFIIVILAALFFISGLLHLLVRFLKKKRPISSPERWSSEAALQRQLQQLFHLHDSGLDQASIDALPAFRYADVVGPKHPFDCAVCLSEFSPDDSLRLLPTCSHAFHVSCIDTWLLSNSTCPICRAALVDNPVFDYDAADDYLDDAEAAAEIHLDAGPDPTSKGVLQLQVKLGKFRKLDVEEDPGFVHHEASDSNLDARRCYSMGSYQYVVGNTNLRVALCPPHHKLSPDGNKIISSVSRGDSYSVSKIWLWQKKGSSSGGGGGPGDARIDLPSFNTEYPWIDRTPNDV